MTVRHPGRAAARTVLACSLALSLLLPPLGDTASAAGSTVRVSVSTGGRQADGDSGAAVMSANGRWVAFQSEATNLTPDYSYLSKVLVRDVRAGTTIAIAQDAYYPSISADGRYVAFQKLFRDPSGSGPAGIVVYDRDADSDGVYDERDQVASYVVSRSSTGERVPGSNPAISASGKTVVFTSQSPDVIAGETADGTPQLYAVEWRTGHIARVSASTGGERGNDWSMHASVSAGGRVVAFRSYASNLVGGDTNNFPDVFVRERDTDADGILDEPGAVRTTRVNVSGSGEQSNDYSMWPSISGNGRFVAYTSAATNLVAGDTEGYNDVFVYDRAGRRTARLSVSPAGSAGLGHSYAPVVGGNGRFLAFPSYAANLAPDDTNGVMDVFLRDRDVDMDGIYDEPGAVSVTRVSVGGSGAQANAGSASPALTPDGRFVTFSSAATNLVAGDTNGHSDVFRHYRGTP